MKRARLLTLGVTALVVTTLVALPKGAANEPIDYASLARIRAEGLQNSQVMDLASWMTDVYGPRLSGSPNIQKAGEWAVATMKEWGLQNVAMEPWANQTMFPRGWSNDKFYLAAVSPQSFSMTGMSTAWTPGTNGLIRGDAVLVTATTEEDLKKLSGTLRGKFVMTDPAPDVAAFWSPTATRYTKEQLDELELGTPRPPEFGTVQPGAGRAGAAGGRGGRGGAPGAAPFNRTAFFIQEGVAAVLTTHPRGHGNFRIGGANRGSDPATLLPSIVVVAEHYGRIARMLEKNLPVQIEADIRNTYHPNPTMFDVVGEIRGTDKADEVVMLGAHFDSWHPGTGATDNAAGSAAMMEAMRILKASGVTLRRTVRLALWNGEEQGLIGSRDYVAKHFASSGGRGAGAPVGGAARGVGGGRGANAGPLQVTPAHAKFSGYFNIDNGGGAIRGIYLQGNQAVAPIFRAWIEPLRDLGVTHVTIRNTGGTDHQSFDGVGLPGFQFIQDPLEYSSFTHHSNMDTFERLQPDDMRKNATIAAIFAFLTANRDDLLPRKPMRQ
jgi:carboxypeptidase Q